MEVRRDILWRVYISFIGIIILGMLVLGRAFYIQRVQGSYWRSMSDSLHQKYIPVNADRGTIYSEDGQMLSTSIPTFDIYLDFGAEGLREKNGKRFNDNLDSFAISLSHYFGDKTVTQYKKDLTEGFDSHDRYYPLKKKLSFEDYKAFRNFPLVKLGKNKSGVIVEVKSKRLSPFGLLANRTIGLSRDHVDSAKKIKKVNVGLEKSYDTVLTGRDGLKLVRYIAGGMPIPVDGYQTEPENGKDVYTTIDVNIQDISETALMKMMVQSESKYGTAIVMETATGKIKAIANLGRRDDGTYWEDNNYALNVTEPGSTIKLATLLSILEEKSSTLTDLVEVGSEGRMIVGPRMVNDAERQHKPILTVKECFAHSSNVGMSKLAYKAFASNPDKLRQYFHRFYLDEKSPVDLKDLPQPRLASFKSGDGGLSNMVTASYGYAIQVSPLHTLTLYNAVANNGRMMKPYLVNSIEYEGRPIRQFQPSVLSESICRPEVINAAKECMEAVVTMGTAKLAFKNMPFPIAGKTGTAHVADGKLQYGDGVYQASFVGYFPIDHPQYSCIVVIRTKPHALLHFGGDLAAPVFREIAIKLYAAYIDKKIPTLYTATRDSSSYCYAGYSNDIKNVYKTLDLSYTDSVQQNNWGRVYAGDVPNKNLPVIKTNPVKPQLMPNVKGMGLKDALYLLENMGIKVTMKGRGKIITQSVAPGSQLSKGMIVMLELS